MKQRILMVDDEKGFAELVRLNLERTGLYEVRVENRGANAVAAALEFKPDLVLLDVIMPDLDGGDVLNRLRATEPLKDIPVIFLTATVSREEARSPMVQSGGLRFLPKPVSVKTLVTCIEACLRG